MPAVLNEEINAHVVCPITTLNLELKGSVQFGLVAKFLHCDGKLFDILLTHLKFSDIQ